jgi:hypothetical protein
MANDKKTPAPEAVRCELDGCGAGQPLYTTNGLNHCAHHADWPTSKEGRKVIAHREIDKESV